ncbi:hypothetical protein ACIQWA_00920 [Kitasatospora sp. NPDC098652]|uniref:hypothetical protein n=1 Tax=Kitasatospora sp. NPDC098652 TaxID=3364095 RepID=UPI00382BE321
MTDAQFYRARVWHPAYNAIGDATQGTVSDGAVSGALRTPALIDTNSQISRISAAALPDGTMHVQTLVLGPLPPAAPRATEAGGPGTTAS